MSLWKRIVRALTGGKPVSALVRFLNRSRLRHLVKWVVVLRHPGMKLNRVAAARGLAVEQPLAKQAQHLTDHGYARLNGELDAALVSELQKYGSDQLARLPELDAQPSGRRKDFWVYLSDEGIGRNGLTTDHILVRFALQDALLRIAASYFGEVPYLSYVLLTYSRHTDSPLKISQLWHKDYDDTKILKLFTYLSDVTQIGSGPFTFLDRKTSHQVRSPFFLRHLEDAHVFGTVRQDAPIQMTARAQTSFLVDTGACYHMGSRVAPNHSRLMYTALYTSSPSIFPDAVGNNIAVAGSVTPLQEMALKLRSGARLAA